jgi:hypothetical protein
MFIFKLAIRNNEIAFQGLSTERRPDVHAVIIMFLMVDPCHMLDTIFICFRYIIICFLKKVYNQYLNFISCL